MAALRHTFIESDKSPFDRIKDCLFDILMITLSEVDTLTDIYITYTFWRNGQWSYLYISIAILTVAHFAYCLLFLYIFKSKKYNSWPHHLLLLIVLLPLSPFLPFILYLTADPDSRCSHFIHSLIDIKVEPDDLSRCTELYQQTDPTKRWIRHNLRSHLAVCYLRCLFSLSVYLQSVSPYGFSLKYRGHLFLCILGQSHSNPLTDCLLIGCFTLTLSQRPWCHQVPCSVL